MSDLDKLMNKIQLDYVSDEPEVKQNIKMFIKSLIPKKKTGFREMSLNKWNYSKGFNDAVDQMKKKADRL